MLTPVTLRSIQLQVFQRDDADRAGLPCYVLLAATDHHDHGQFAVGVVLGEGAVAAEQSGRGKGESQA
jgi:hypothetical protein